MLGNEPKTVSAYLKDYGRKGRITQRQLEQHIEKIGPVLATEIGRNLLFDDIVRFESLLWRLIDKGYGYEKDQIDDDLLVEMRFLKARILTLSDRVSQYLELVGGRNDG
jgi:hypothetical protein